MESHQQNSPDVINHYEPKSGMRTAAGVLSAMFIMGLPIGLTELLRAGGDLKIALYSGVATVIAIVLALFSIRGGPQY
jgi:hypothetical protein